MSLDSTTPIYLLQDCDIAARWEEQLPIPEVSVESALPEGSAVLRVREGCLGIEWARRKDSQRYVVDFTAPHWQKRRHQGPELLLKALGAGAKRPVVTDFTAGFARDSWILAMHGYHVQAIEEQPLVVALVQDGLDRASAAGGEWQLCASRLNIRCEKAESLLDSGYESELSYFDPMFEHKAKKKALSSKDLQWLQVLAKPAQPEAAEHLLARMLKRTQYRVVAKRGLKAPVLEAPRCSHSLKAKAHRFDVYALQSLSRPAEESALG